VLSDLPRKSDIGYVLAMACSAEVATAAGTFRADAPARNVPTRAWQKLSAGRGAKGQRFYDWTVVDRTEPHLRHEDHDLRLEYQSRVHFAGHWCCHEQARTRGCRPSRPQGRTGTGPHAFLTDIHDGTPRNDVRTYVRRDARRVETAYLPSLESLGVETGPS